MKALIRSPLVWLSLVAAFLYSSWPWGLVLDPAVARHSLASQLEAPHHPYSWLFIAMDVATGLVLILIGATQLIRHRTNTINRGVVMSYVLFGVLVMIAAFTPLVCDPTVQSCGPLVHNYRILIHGIASVSSVMFLLAALLGVTIDAYRDHGANLATGALIFIMMGWLLFGIGSVGSILLRLHNGNNLQDYFITLCSLSVVAVVSIVEHRAVHTSATEKLY